MGEAAIHCHGIQLAPLEAEPSDECHMIFIERVEDEYYVRIDHSRQAVWMISFLNVPDWDLQGDLTFKPVPGLNNTIHVFGILFCDDAAVIFKH